MQPLGLGQNWPGLPEGKVMPPIERWNISAPLRPLAGGFRNVVLRTVGLNRELVFKTTLRSEDAMVWVSEVQDVARGCGLVVPQMVQSTSGQFVEEGWVCEAFSDGASAKAEDMTTMTPMMSAFHARTSAVFQRPGFLSSTELLDSERGGDVDLSGMPQQLVEICRAAWEAVVQTQEAVVHGDINVNNLLRCPDGRLVLLDWDECRFDKVLFDLAALGEVSPAERRAALAWEVACSWQIEPEHAQALAARL